MNLRTSLSTLLATAAMVYAGSSMAACEGKSCTVEERILSLEQKLAKAQETLAEVAGRNPALDCHTVTRDSEPLLYEDGVALEDAPGYEGYTLVAGGCSFLDPQKYERPAIVSMYPQGNRWVCSYKNSRPGRIRGYATFCKAVMKD